MLTSYSSFALTAFLLLPCAVLAQTPTPTSAAPASQYGWLEGTVTNTQGTVIQRQGYSEGVHVTLRSTNGVETETTADANMGGLYSFHNIKPGIYDIILPKGQIVNTFYCPERIFGVVVKPGERTIYKVVMDQGETYEEVGKPTVISAPATNVTEELTKMHKQIDDLKQQVAALLKATAVVAPALSTSPVAKP